MLLGLAGSGKSTQGKLLENTGRYRWLSMGALLRERANPSEQSQMMTGAILPDAATIGYIEAELLALGDDPEVLIDGFPRTRPQADWLLQYSRLHQPIRAIIYLQAEKDALRARLVSRGRADDIDEVIDERFLEFEQAIAPVMNDFIENGVPIIVIDASKPVDTIHHQIVRELEDL